jgi:hypothetical protein
MFSREIFTQNFASQFADSTGEQSSPAIFGDRYRFGDQFDVIENFKAMRIAKAQETQRAIAVATQQAAVTEPGKAALSISDALGGARGVYLLIGVIILVLVYLLKG